VNVGDFLIGRGEVYVSRANVCGLRVPGPATRADILENTL